MLRGTQKGKLGGVNLLAVQNVKKQPRGHISAEVMNDLVAYLSIVDFQLLGSKQNFH
jgi:hypothetical protein